MVFSARSTEDFLGHKNRLKPTKNDEILEIGKKLVEIFKNVGKIVVDFFLPDFSQHILYPSKPPPPLWRHWMLEKKIALWHSAEWRERFGCEFLRVAFVAVTGSHLTPIQRQAGIWMGRVHQRTFGSNGLLLNGRQCYTLSWETPRKFFVSRCLIFSRRIFPLLWNLRDGHSVTGLLGEKNDLKNPGFRLTVQWRTQCRTVSPPNDFGCEAPSRTLWGGNYVENRNRWHKSSSFSTQSESTESTES